MYLENMSEHTPNKAVALRLANPTVLIHQRNEGLLHILRPAQVASLDRQGDSEEGGARSPRSAVGSIGSGGEARSEAAASAAAEAGANSPAAPSSG